MVLMGLTHAAVVLGRFAAAEVNPPERRGAALVGLELVGLDDERAFRSVIPGVAQARLIQRAACDALHPVQTEACMSTVMTMPPMARPTAHERFKRHSSAVTRLSRPKRCQPDSPWWPT